MSIEMNRKLKELCETVERQAREIEDMKQQLAALADAIKDTNAQRIKTHRRN